MSKDNINSLNHGSGDDTSLTETLGCLQSSRASTGIINTRASPLLTNNFYRNDFNSESLINGNGSDDDHEQKWTQVSRSSSLRHTQKKKLQITTNGESSTSFSNRGQRRGWSGRGGGYNRPSGTLPRGKSLNESSTNQFRHNGHSSEKPLGDNNCSINSSASSPVSCDLSTGHDSGHSRGSNRFPARYQRNRGSLTQFNDGETIHRDFPHRFSSPPAAYNSSSNSINPRCPNYNPHDEYRRSNNRRPYRPYPHSRSNAPQSYNNRSFHPTYGRNRPFPRGYNDNKRIDHVSDVPYTHKSESTGDTSCATSPTSTPQPCSSTNKTTWADAVSVPTQNGNTLTPDVQLLDYLINKWKIFNTHS